MSIDIRIDSYDISDMDERLERAFDIRNEWGIESVSDDNIKASADDKHFPLGSVHAVIQRQQETIDAQERKIHRLITGIKKLETTVHNITDALDTVGKTFFKIK